MCTTCGRTGQIRPGGCVVQGHTAGGRGGPCLRLPAQMPTTLGAGRRRPESPEPRPWLAPYPHGTHRARPKAMTGASKGQLMPGPVLGRSAPPGVAPAAGHQMPTGCRDQGGLSPVTAASAADCPRLMACCRRGSLASQPATGRQGDGGNANSRGDSREAKARRRADCTLQHGDGPVCVSCVVDGIEVPHPAAHRLTCRGRLLSAARRHPHSAFHGVTALQAAACRI